jgi:hypothetical protein
MVPRTSLSLATRSMSCGRWVFNAGRQYRRPPADIILDSAHRTALRFSEAGNQSVRLDQAHDRVEDLTEVPDWLTLTPGAFSGNSLPPLDRGWNPVFRPKISSVSRTDPAGSRSLATRAQCSRIDCMAAAHSLGARHHGMDRELCALMGVNFAPRELIPIKLLRKIRNRS